MVLLLVACVLHAAAHKFLDSDSGGGRLVADAAEEKLELGKFFDEVTSEASKLQKELDATQAKNQELEAKATQAVGELKHAKSVFAAELHKVEARVQSKVKALTEKNEKQAEELSRAKLSLVLHEKTEDALRQRLEDIGKVFSSQERAVQNIIETTSDVDSKLKKHDTEKAEVVEAKAEDVEAKAEAKADKVDDVKVDDVKVDESDVKVDDAVDDKTDDAKVDDVKVEDDAKVEEKVDKDATADAVPEEKKEPAAATVALTHAEHKAKAKPVAKSEDLDLDDSKAKAPVEAKESSDMDSIKQEVDALDKEVDDSDAAPKSESSTMLVNAGDALNKLLKS